MKLSGSEKRAANQPLPPRRGFCFFYPSTSTGNFADPAGVVIGLTSRRRRSNDNDRRRIPRIKLLPKHGSKDRSERSLGKFSTCIPVVPRIYKWNTNNSHFSIPIKTDSNPIRPSLLLLLLLLYSCYYFKIV